MAKHNVLQFNLMVGTCSDIDSEGIDKVIIDTIIQWNRTNRDRDINLMPEHWKISVSPLSGANPQEIIDEQMTNRCDALIACLWTKGGHGVEHEIDKFIKAGKPVMIYYYRGTPSSMEIFDKSDKESLEFIKNKYQGVLYNEDITSKDEFKYKHITHLNELVLKLQKINNGSINDALKKEFAVNEVEEFSIIDHAYSEYEKRNLNIINSNKSFIWNIPSDFKTELIRKKFILGDDAENISGKPYSAIKNCDIKIKQKLIHFIKSNFDITDTDLFLNNIAEQTAQFFLNKEGTNNFNGSALGVYSINRNRTIIGEFPVVDIELYISDYFTFKFMSILYAELIKLNGDVFTIKSFDDVNRLIPFLNSVGIGGFICFDRGEGAELLLAKRGPHVSCPNHWHFSYDETFSLVDQSSIGSTYEFDYKRCLHRALKEEVMGNDNKVETLLDQSAYGFTDIGVIKTDTRLEFELCGYINITFSDMFTYHDLVEKYQIAPDANWETSAMLPININNIERFINNHTLTPECKVLLKRIRSRIKAGKINIS